MILYVVNGILLWWHEDVSVKEQDNLKNDNNCIVVDEALSIPSAPQDGYHYSYTYNSETNQVSIVKGNKIELSHNDLTNQIHKNNDQIQKDTLLGLELQTLTSETVTRSGGDSLLLMELLVTLDEKLSKLLQSK